MSTGNDPALPADQPNPTVTDAAVAAVAADGGAAAAPGLTFVSPQPVDVDDVELNAAKTAAKAENTAGEGDGQGDGTTGTDPAKAAAAAAAPGDQPQPGQQPAPVMIPKARLDEALSKQSEAERKAAYWQGRAEAGGTPQGQPSGGQQQQQQQPTPKEQIASHRKEITDLATKYDNGEITYADLKTKEAEIADKIDTLREQVLIDKVKPAAAAPSSGNDELYLETLTAKLEVDHPWVKPFNAVATDSEWSFVSQKAREELASRGVELKGTIGSYELRKEISAQIDKLAPALIADRAAQAQAKGIAFPGTQTPGAPPAKTPSQQVIDRQNGLRKAAGAPPDLSTMNGHTGDINGQPTDARLDVMSDEEIGALPVSVRNKLLGIEA